MKIEDVRYGQLVYLKNVGFPYNRTDDGHESFEGASAIIVGVNVGANKKMIDVEFLYPMKTTHGTMDTCLFYPEQLREENRPWLKKNLKQILAFRQEVRRMGAFCERMMETP